MKETFGDTESIRKNICDIPGRREKTLRDKLERLRTALWQTGGESGEKGAVHKYARIIEISQRTLSISDITRREGKEPYSGFRFALEAI